METEAGNNANDTDAGTTPTTQEREIVVSDATNEDEDAFWEKHQEDLESKLFRMYRGALHETPQGSQTSTWAKRAYQEFLRNTQTQSKDEVPNDPQAWKCMHDLALAACASGAHVNLVMFHAARIPLAVRQHLFDMLIIECCRNGHADALKSLVSMALVSEFTVELSDFIDEIGPSPSLDLGIMDEANNSAIHMACLHGFLECVRCLVETGEDDVNRRSRGNASSGATPLHAAAMGGHIDIIAYLLKAGAEPSPLANDGTSPLHLACARDRADAVKFLMFRTDQDPFTQAASGQRRSIPPGALAGSPVDESQDSLHIAGLSAFETAAIFASSNAVRAILHMVSSDVAALVRRSRASVEQPQRGKDGNAPEPRSGNAADPATHRPESVVARQGLVPFMFRSMLLALSSYAGEEDEVTQDEARAEIITNISNFLPPEKLSKVLSMHYKGVPGKADIPTEIRGDTLLHVGARLGRGRCVQALLNAGADVTVRNVKGETAVDCSMPFLLKPENTTALRAVRSLVAEWERLRVSADQTMEAMLQDEVHGAGEATGSAEPSSHEHADVRSPAKDDSVKVPGTGLRKKRTRRSKKKSKKRTSAPSASSAQKATPATEGNENAPEKGENAHDDALSQDAGSSGSASDHETACSADSHKKLQGAEKRTGIEEVDDDGQGWVLAQGGKVKFADHEASGAGLATEEMMQKRDLQRRLVASLQESLQQTRPSQTREPQSERDEKPTAPEKIPGSNIEKLSSVPVKDAAASQHDASSHTTDAGEQQKGTPLEPAASRAQSPSKQSPPTQSTQSLSTPTPFPVLPPSPDPKNETAKTVSPFRQREIFDIGRFMQQFALTEEEPTAWGANPSSQEGTDGSNSTLLSENTLGMPPSTFAENSATQVHYRSERGPDVSQTVPPGLHAAHPPSSVSREEPAHVLSSNASHRVLFEQLNPEASVLGLKFEHFLGLQLSELSMSQLDTLRALHHRAQEDILEAQLNAARVQGRELAVEDRQRRANFTAFQEHYFGGLDG